MFFFLLVPTWIYLISPELAWPELVSSESASPETTYHLIWVCLLGSPSCLTWVCLKGSCLTLVQNGNFTTERWPIIKRWLPQPLMLPQSSLCFRQESFWSPLFCISGQATDMMNSDSINSRNLRCLWKWHRNQPVAAVGSWRGNFPFI